MILDHHLLDHFQIKSLRGIAIVHFLLVGKLKQISAIFCIMYFLDFRTFKMISLNYVMMKYLPISPLKSPFLINHF
jgi:hypothetical protein